MKIRNRRCLVVWRLDGDGFGNPMFSITACTQPEGFTVNNWTATTSNHTAILPQTNCVTVLTMIGRNRWTWRNRAPIWYQDGDEDDSGFELNGNRAFSPKTMGKQRLWRQRQWHTSPRSTVTMKMTFRWCCHNNPTDGTGVCRQWCRWVRNPNQTTSDSQPDEPVEGGDCDDDAPDINLQKKSVMESTTTVTKASTLMDCWMHPLHFDGDEDGFGYLNKHQSMSTTWRLCQQRTRL